MSKEVDMGINLYEFNKVNMGKLPVLLSKEEVEGAKTQLRKFIDETCSNYYMLLNHEKKDFTLFNFRNENITKFKINSMADDIVECMYNRGLVLIDVNTDEAGIAMEIWTKDRHTEAVYMYLLFPYNEGVIEY